MSAVLSRSWHVLRRVFEPKPKRFPAWVWINIASAVTIVFVVLLTIVQATWHFGVAPLVKCLPEDYFLIGQMTPERIEAGKAYRFVARDLGPVIPDRAPLVKIAAAVAGDRVEVNQSGIYINGELWGPLNYEVMTKAGVSVAEVTRRYTVPDGQVLMLGTLPRSYDGRYFGTVDRRLITGRAIPLW